jgi:2,3-bisphosphoglycerate-independent phosphoglycerate mutase
MKYVVIIGDGMADRPLKELGNKTPLQKAFTPNMDRIAQEGIIGSARTIPPNFYPGSDVANLSILGYDPLKFYTGRAPLEAASIGVKLNEDDISFRCNLITLKYDKKHKKAIMEDYSSGHITTEEARELISVINNELSSEDIHFYAGVSYRHLMVWSGGPVDVDCIPPHDILGKDISDYLPVGNGEEVLRGLIFESSAILERHPVNIERIKRGLRPANSIWLWGQGKKPSLPSFKERYSIDGALVSAVDLTRGIGINIGLKILEVPNITGYLDTNYRGKAEYSLNALKDVDFVYIHIEAPDEAGHSGNYRDKIKAIEDIDSLVVGTVMKGLEDFDEYRVLLMPDHATPIEVRTHTDEPVPFVILDNRRRMKNDNAFFDETLLERKGILNFNEGYKLMDYFIKSD